MLNKEKKDEPQDRIDELYPHDSEKFRVVIDHHIRTAIDLMKASGEGIDPKLCYELEPYLLRKPK